MGQQGLAARTVKRVRLYAELTKIRLVTLVVITVGVGYLMAAGDGWSAGRLAWTALGTALAAAGAMALNEWMEAPRDARMERTRHRPLPTGDLSPAHALLFGLAVATGGIAILALTVTSLTAGLGLAVVLIYTLIYTPLKPRTTLCTLVGAVCGAVPPMMGWSAAGGSLGLGAWILAAVLFLWQIPHFLSLAWLYREDYARGGFRMLPVVDHRGGTTAAVAIFYTVALLPVSLTASLAGVAGGMFAVGALGLGVAFLAPGLALARSHSEASARRLFLASLLYLPLLLGLMVVDRQSAGGQRWAAIAARAAATFHRTIDAPVSARGADYAGD